MLSNLEDMVIVTTSIFNISFSSSNTSSNECKINHPLQAGKARMVTSIHIHLMLICNLSLLSMILNLGLVGNTALPRFRLKDNH